MFRFLSLITLFIANTISAQVNVVGTWNQPRAIHVRQYTFAKDGSFRHDGYGDVSEEHFTGHYSMNRDSIFLSYDSALVLSGTHAGMMVDHWKDTLYVINEHIIKVNEYIYLYNEPLTYTQLTVDENGVMEFYMKSLGDTFYLEQNGMFGWRIVDTFSTPVNKFIDIHNYQLPLHSGENTFWIVSNYAHYRVGTLDVDSHQPVVKIKNKTVYDTLYFGAPTYYILFDKYGTVMSKGTSDHIDMTGMPEGKYQLSYDNDIAEVRKRNRK